MAFQWVDTTERLAGEGNFLRMKESLNKDGEIEHWYGEAEGHIRVSLIQIILQRKINEGHN